jgi:hypothetical protein
MDLRVVLVIALGVLLVVGFVLRSRAAKSSRVDSPIERRRARVVAKREVNVGDRVRRVVGFQIAAGDREDFSVDDRTWDRLVEGTEGTLRSQDEKFIGFSGENPTPPDGDG